MGRAPRKGDLGCRETSPGLSLRAGLSTSNKPNTSQKNSSRSEATQELLFLSRRGNVEAWKHRSEPPVALARGSRHKLITLRSGRSTKRSLKTLL
jgi:hypothetical protein